MRFDYQNGVEVYREPAYPLRMAKRTRRKPAWVRFTAQEVADTVGRSRRRVWNDALAGLVDPSDLRSVARYVVGLAPVSQSARASYLALGVALGIGGKVGGVVEEGIPYAATVPTGSGGGGGKANGERL